MSSRSVVIHPTLRVLFLLVCAALFLGLLSFAIINSNVFASIFSGFGLAVVIVWSGTRMFSPKDSRSQATERTLRVASAALSHMADGLSQEGCMAVCQLLLSETSARGIAMTDTRTTLAYVGDPTAIQQMGTPISDAVKRVLESKRVQTFSAIDQMEWVRELANEAMRHNPHAEEHDVSQKTTVSLHDKHAQKENSALKYSRSSVQTQLKTFPAGIIAPLVVAERSVGTLKLYYAHGRDISHTQLTIVRGLAELLSTQLSVYELDRQAELTARAELKALQAQINPHFLFNTLNTIASFTRTNPEKARALLRDFSSFYRHTLESSQTLIPLSDELAQTRRYLQIEKARFGEERIIETEHIAPECASMLVPGFIVQPIVENAVRHAMRDTDPLNIDIQAVVDGKDVLLAVTDDGLGMDEACAQALMEAAYTPARKNSKGTGIALHNVAERIERFYGAPSGVEIVSKLGEGTCVTLRLCDVALSHQEK